MLKMPYMEGKRIFILACTLLCRSLLWGEAETGSDFNVNLILNFESADKTVELYEGRAGRPSEIATLRGSQIVLGTTASLAQQPLGISALEAALETAKFGQTQSADIFRMKEARHAVSQIKELLDEIRRRNFAQKVVSTVEQLFPAGTQISTSIPVYFVAFGHHNIDAYVHRIVWRGNSPVFVGEGQGELTIVVNLAKAVYYGGSPDERFVGTMSVVAHEVFHAVFGVYKDQSRNWRNYYATHRAYIDRLFDLTQNEGIAYYLSLIQRSRGNLHPEWVPKVHASFMVFNKNAAELFSTKITHQRAGELIRLANTSGYWESYGSITGMIMARQIDQTLGRLALVETIANGPADFFGKYIDLMQRDNTIPNLSNDILRHFGRSRN